MKTLGTIMFTAILAAQAFAQSMTIHSDTKHGFRLSHPADWTVKEAMTEAMVFKAVQKFADGQYLMLTVNAQPSDLNDYSMADFKIEDAVNGYAEGYGAMTLRSSGRDQVSGYQSVWLLVDKHAALVKPKVEYTVLVIKGRYFYIISASCTKPLYAQYENLIKQLADSFVFVTEPGDKPLPAFLKAFGETWFKYLVIGILFAAGSAVWAKLKGKKKATETSNKAIESDKE